MTEPVVRVMNHAHYPVCIARDPNWDDQVLLIGGRESNRTRCLDPGADTSVGVHIGGDTEPDENLMGVLFADAKDIHSGQAGVYQATIGHHPETGLLSMTDTHTLGSPSLRYTVSNQTQWSMDLTFVDAS